MREKVSFVLAFLFLACLWGAVGCGGGGEMVAEETSPAGPMPEDPEEIREYIQGKMKAMEEKIGDMDAGTAEELATAVAREWDAGARLYQLEGERRLKPEGTAMQWSASFAVREDPEHQQSTERGKKFILLMMDHKVMSEHAYEAPDKIKHKGPCRSFLPENRLTGAEAYTKCFATLAEKHGADAETAEPKRLTCLGRQGYAIWELSMRLNGSPISAEIDSVTGEVLKVK